MSWLDDLTGIVDDTLSVVTKPTKIITGTIKDVIDEICDN